MNYNSVPKTVKRGLIASGAALVLTACTGNEDLPASSSTAPETTLQGRVIETPPIITGDYSIESAATSASQLPKVMSYEEFVNLLQNQAELFPNDHGAVVAGIPGMRVTLNNGLHISRPLVSYDGKTTNPLDFTTGVNTPDGISSAGIETFNMAAHGVDINKVSYWFLHPTTNDIHAFTYDDIDHAATLPPSRPDLGIDVVQIWSKGEDGLLTDGTDNFDFRLATSSISEHPYHSAEFDGQCFPTASVVAPSAFWSIRQDCDNVNYPK